MSNIRQTIIDAMETRFGELSEIERVAVWHVGDWPNADLPSVDIRDVINDMPTDGIGAGRIDHDLTIKLTARTLGNTCMVAAREMIATLIASIGTDPTWAGQAYDTIINGDELDLEDANQLIAAAEISITIRYRSGMWSI